MDERTKNILGNVYLLEGENGQGRSEDTLRPASVYYLVGCAGWKQELLS